MRIRFFWKQSQQYENLKKKLEFSSPKNAEMGRTVPKKRGVVSCTRPKSRGGETFQLRTWHNPTPPHGKGCDTDSLGKLTKMDASYFKKKPLKSSLFPFFRVWHLKWIQMIIPGMFFLVARVGVFFPLSSCPQVSNCPTAPGSRG